MSFEELLQDAKQRGLLFLPIHETEKYVKELKAENECLKELIKDTIARQLHLIKILEGVTKKGKTK